MELLLLRSVWSGPKDLDKLIDQTLSGGFNGIEGPIPKDPAQQKALQQKLQAANLSFIAEATTGTDPNSKTDWWIPKRDRTPQQHLNDLRWTVERAADMNARFVSTMCGYDGWSWSQNLLFFEQALTLEQQFNLTISFETHRSRSLFNPWITRDLLDHFPNLKLTCDFSHWCVVCERLLTDETDLIQRCAQHAQHIHSRVGYAQHAQVSDPRAPEFTAALLAHESWWDMIWTAQHQRGMTQTTMNPEFLWDGYLQTLPFTQAPVANLWKITTWMAHRQKQRFKTWQQTHQLAPSNQTNKNLINQKQAHHKLTR